MVPDYPWVTGVPSVSFSNISAIFLFSSGAQRIPNPGGSMGPLNPLSAAPGLREILFRLQRGAEMISWTFSPPLLKRLTKQT